jgi:hypothetical protein
VQTKTKLGVTLAGAGILLFGAYVLWDDTRVRAPLSVPIQISAGAVVQGDFWVNVNGPYAIEIVAEKTIDFDTLNCLLDMRIDLRKKCPAAEAVESQWAVTQGQKVIASGSSSGYHGGAWASGTVTREIGNFDAKSYHTYHLKVKFLDDGKALYETNPQLVVALNSDVKDDLFRFALVFFVCAVLVLTGSCLLIASAVARLRRSPTRTASGSHP